MNVRFSCGWSLHPLLGPNLRPNELKPQLFPENITIKASSWPHSPITTSIFQVLNRIDMTDLFQSRIYRYPNIILMDHIFWSKSMPMSLTQHPDRPKKRDKNDPRPAAASRRRRGTPWAPEQRRGLISMNAWSVPKHVPCKSGRL